MTNPLSNSAYMRLFNLQAALHAWTRDTAAEYEVDDTAPDHPLWPFHFNYLSVAPMLNGLHVEYHGSTYETPFDMTIACLSEQVVADSITSLAFSGPDEGANGTREWTFSGLLDSQVRFPILRALYVRPTEPDHHNGSIIVREGSILDEGGDIARLVARMPYLTEMTVPNAPDAGFFEHSLPHLEALRIGGNFDTKYFIRNLASADTMPNLTRLDFTESTELQMTWAKDREEALVTPFAAYERLFESAVGAQLKALVLRNTRLSREELEHLQTIRPGLQFMVIQAAQGGYVSHFRRRVFPFKHLVQTDPGVE